MRLVFSLGLWIVEIGCNKGCENREADGLLLTRSDGGHSMGRETSARRPILALIWLRHTLRMNIFSLEYNDKCQPATLTHMNVASTSLSSRVLHRHRHMLSRDFMWRPNVIKRDHMLSAFCIHPLNLSSEPRSFESLSHPSGIAVTPILCCVTVVRSIHSFCLGFCESRNLPLPLAPPRILVSSR